MRYILLLILSSMLISCAVKTVEVIEEKKVDPKKLAFQLEDKLYEISKLTMAEEANISKTDSLYEALKSVKKIQENIDISLDIINEFKEKSDDEKYLLYIYEAECTYKSLTFSYDFMRTSLESEIDIPTDKELAIQKAVQKIRENAIHIFIKEMGKCIREKEKELQAQDNATMDNMTDNSTDSKSNLEKNVDNDTLSNKRD